MDDGDEPPQLVESADDDVATTAAAAGTPTDAAALAKTKVTIITGFLGAGKTTLLRHIMTAQHGLRIAIIENEFGSETGIEASILSGADGTQYGDLFEFSNGCVCCSAKYVRVCSCALWSAVAAVVAVVVVVG